MPDEKIILMGRMNVKNDLAMTYSFYWAEKIKEEAAMLGYTVIDLQNENFKEDKLKKMIEQFDPFLIFLNAHGTSYSVLDQNKKEIIVRCKDDHIFKGRLVYCLSCSNGSILGRSAFNKGCKCYIGYREVVTFPTKEMYDDVFKDFVSEPFMMVSNEIVLTLLKKKIPEEAINSAQKKASELIEYWKNQEKPEAPTIVKHLNQIKTNIIMHAN